MMNEKTSIKISLSTFFLILSIIIIIIMGFFMYKLYNEKSIAIQEISDLNNEVSTLENTVSNFQEKIDSISNTINSNFENSTINNSSSKNTNNSNIPNNQSTNTSSESSNNSNEQTHIGTYKKSKSINIDNSQMSDYIVLEEKTFYLTDDLNTVSGLPGTYKKDSKNNISFNYSSEDNAFFGAASAKIKTIDGKINIILENGNEIMYFEKIK